MNKNESLTMAMENRIMPIANKFARQRHLVAIRDAFMSLLPINLVGGLCAIIKSAPVTEGTTSSILLAWKSFADANGFAFEWLYTLTLGAMSLYICIGVAFFLCKHYNIPPLLPILFSTVALLITCGKPIELGWAGRTMSVSYIDGKGLLPGILIAIVTVELYRLMKNKNLFRINLPPSVPASLSEVFATMIPGTLLIIFYFLVFYVFNIYELNLPEFLYTKLTPAYQAADSLPSVIIITLVTHFLWFFGIHDAALSGIVGPIRDGNLSINAGAQMAGQALPHIYTTPFWVYYVIIGGCGVTLGLSVLLLFSKSKQLKTVGRVGILPSFFNISEPIIFGVPLMMNPIFFIPFLGAATINAIIVYLSMASGLLAKTFAMVSWSMPSVFGAFFSSLDWKAPVTIILLTILDALIYLPFLRIYDRNQMALEAMEAENEKSK